MKRFKISAARWLQQMSEMVQDGWGLARLIGLFVLFAATLQWLFAYKQFNEIFIKNTAGLGFYEKVEVFIEAFFALFRYGNDLTPIGIITIAFLQASAVLLWLRLRAKAKARYEPHGLVAGFVGAGCVACGGSLLPVAASIFGITISSVLLQNIGDLLLLIAIGLSVTANFDIVNKGQTRG